MAGSVEHTVEIITEWLENGELNVEAFEAEIQAVHRLDSLLVGNEYANNAHFQEPCWVEEGADHPHDVTACPGWDLFYNEETEIQRCDVCDRYEDDDAAIAHVIVALQGLTSAVS